MAAGEGLGLSYINEAYQYYASLPIYIQVALVGGAGAAFVAYKLYQQIEDKDTLEASDWNDRMNNMLRKPVSAQGAKISDLLKKQATSNTKRTIGKAVRVQKTSTNIGGEHLEDMIDKDTLEEYKEKQGLTVTAMTYQVIPGRRPIDRAFNTLVFYGYQLVGASPNPAMETYDLPEEYIQVTDNGILIKDDVHLFKKNGLWQVADWKHQERISQLSHLGVHQNYLESLQKHPEFYSDLNMDVSGKKNVMNQKSENMKDYKKSERLEEKKRAMDE